MRKLGLVTAESMYINNKPVVKLFCRDEDGKKVIGNFVSWPYFYLTEKAYLSIDEADRDSIFRNCTVEGTGVRTLTKEVLSKITLGTNQDVGKLTHNLYKLSKVGEVGESLIYSYEADLAESSMLAIRFLIDRSIRCGLDYDTMQPIDFIPKLRRWYIDFEALTDKQAASGPKKDNSIPIVSFYDSYDESLYTLIVDNPKWIGKGKQYGSNMFINVEQIKHIIQHYKTERGMLLALTEYVKKLDPDLITAWNLDRYDIAQWIYRLQANGLDPKELSPIKITNYRSRPYRIRGRILFDLMRAFKRFTDAELRSYSLGAISEAENLGIAKIPFKGTTQQMWDDEPWLLYQRNVNDVLILLALDKKYEVIELFDDLRREFGALFSEALLNSRVIDTALMRMVNGKIALRTAKKEHTPNKYLGAVVVEPVPGEYEYIAQFDFSREYPSLLKAFNIGPETYIGPDNQYKGPCFVIEYHDKVFKFAKSPRSLPSHLIEYFFTKRTAYEKLLSAAIKEKDEVHIKMWDRKVYNVKRMTNAVYGVLDFPSFRLYRSECSAAIATASRIGIEELTRFISGVIYGDTDSIFVQLLSRTQEEALIEAKDLEIRINEHLSEFYQQKYDLKTAPTGMGLKKIYSNFILIAKKNYAGKSFYDERKGYKTEYDFKGLEIVRSDSSDLEKSVMEKIVRSRLDNVNLEDIMRVKEQVLLSLETCNPLTVAYPLQISDPLTKYPKKDKNGRPQMPSHVRSAIYSNTYLNTDYGVGDKPRRLPIKVVKKKKLQDGQQTLFNDKEVYATECIWKNFTFTRKDISINEDFVIPEYFIDRIDWQRIIERLKGKMDRILDVIRKNKNVT